jgi:multisubunit Na+/H+ antiporter MnhB subunit
MTAKTITIIALRLIAVYLFFQLIPAIQSLIYSLTKTEFETWEKVRFSLVLIVLYIMAIIILFKYSVQIADKVIATVPEETVQSNWTPLDILSILIAGSAVLTILSAIPRLITQLYGLSSLYQSKLIYLPEKNMINDSIVGFVGTLLQIVIAGIVFINAKRISEYWEQTTTKNKSDE